MKCADIQDQEALTKGLWGIIIVARREYAEQ